VSPQFLLLLAWVLPNSVADKCDTDLKDVERTVLFFGGSFNPPTEAHLQMPEHLLNLAAVEAPECIWLVPTYHPDYKPNKLPFVHRKGMLEALILTLKPEIAARVKVSEADKQGYDAHAAADRQQEMLHDEEALEFVIRNYPKTKFMLTYGDDSLFEMNFKSWGHNIIRKLGAQKDNLGVIITQRSEDLEAVEAARQALEKEIPSVKIRLAPGLQGLGDMSSSGVRNALCKHADDVERGLEAAKHAGLEAVSAAYMRRNPDVYHHIVKTECGSKKPEL
jgi:nicotinic acid mononucleotide adenylyltransferase